MSEVRPVDPDVQRSVTDLYRLIRDVDERVDGIDGGGDSGGGEGGGIPEAPLDGRQYGRQSAAWSVIELDNGEHVLTGDPENPPAELDAGQLLWDGVEGGSGSGGGGGPHDHDEYLPLEGGTVTGDVRVDGTVKLPNARSAEPMNTAPPNTYITSNGNVTFTGYSIADEIDTAVENAWRTPLTSASPADWNDATTPGWCGLILDSAPNGFASRSSGYFHCQVTNYGYTDNLTQTAIPYSIVGHGPSEMWVRTRYNSNWSAWTCVGGVQTGYVSDKGHYRKHADGTLECWVRSNLPSVPIDAAYGSLFLGSMTWVFPHAFSDNYPTVTVGSAQWGSSASWGATYSTSAASATIRLFDVAARDASRSIFTNVYAIGRWYALGATFDVDAEPPPEETEQDRRDRELEALNVEGA